MVIINTLKIDSLGENLIIDVTTTVGNLFTQILVWDKDTYKVIPSAIDLSASIVGT